MNLPSTQEHRPLIAIYADEGRQVMAMFFAAYDEPWTQPGSNSEDLMTAKAIAYKTAIEGIPEWALKEAYRDFVQGRVERPARQMGKLPKADEIAFRARMHVQHEAHEQHQRKMRQEALEASRQQVVKTPEMRARVQEMYERYCNEQGGTKAHRDAEELRREREEVRERYGMTPEAIETVPDRPLGAWGKAK